MTKALFLTAALAGLAIGLVLPVDTDRQMRSDQPHPMNDAWLGLSVVSELGRKIGYVVDAPIDEDGRIDFLLIDGYADTPTGVTDFLLVDAAFAERRGNLVFIHPSAPGLAAKATPRPAKAARG